MLKEGHPLLVMNCSSPSNVLQSFPKLHCSSGGKKMVQNQFPKYHIDAFEIQEGDKGGGG